MRTALITGPTYRQVDYWVRRGYLHVPAVGANGRGDSTGIPRDWPSTEARIAELMHRLTRAGLTVETAAAVARQHVEHGAARIPLAEGLVLEVAA